MSAKSNSGRLFFLDLGAGRILSVNPDGSDLKTVLTEGQGPHPDGVVVDAARGHIYWTNMGNFKANDGSIERCDLDGKNRRFAVPPGGTHTPKQLQIDKETRKLYWCDREGMRVMRANLDGSNIETLVDTSQGDPRPGPDARKWCVGIAVPCPASLRSRSSRAGMRVGSLTRRSGPAARQPAPSATSTRATWPWLARISPSSKHAEFG